MTLVSIMHSNKRMDGVSFLLAIIDVCFIACNQSETWNGKEFFNFINTILNFFHPIQLIQKGLPNLAYRQSLYTMKTDKTFSMSILSS